MVKELKTSYRTVSANEGAKCHYPTRLDTYGRGGMAIITHITVQNLSLTSTINETIALLQKKYSPYEDG